MNTAFPILEFDEPCEAFIEPTKAIKAGHRLAFYHPGIGAPLAAAFREETIAFGCKKFISCGGCGV